VRLWDLDNGRELLCYQGHLQQQHDPTRPGKSSTNVLYVSDVAFHPQGRWLASVSGNQVHLWDATTGQLVKRLLQLKVDRPLKCLAFHPQGTHLAVGGDDGVVRVLELSSGQEVFVTPARTARIERVAWNNDGSMVALGDSNSQIGVYAWANKQLLLGMTALEQGEVLALSCTPQDRLVLSGRPGRVHVLLLPKPKSPDADKAGLRDGQDFQGHEGAIYALAVSHDGQYLLTGGTDRSVRLWDFASRQQLRRWQGHTQIVTAVAISPDNRWAASASEDGTILLWSLQDSDEHRVFRDAQDSLWAVAYSADGRSLATAGADGHVRIYDPAAGQLVADIAAAKLPITTLDFFPDNRRLALAGGDRDIAIWDIVQRQLVASLPGHSSAVLSVAVAADGQHLLSGGADKTARWWNLEQKKTEWVWNGGSPVCAVAVAPRQQPYLAVGLASGTLVILDSSPATHTRELARQAQANGAGVSAVAFSRDGRRLASVGGDGSIALWRIGDKGTLQLLARLHQPGRHSDAAPLTGVAFSPDGRYLAAVGADTLVHIWDTENRTEVRTLQGPKDWASAVAFSPDGRSLAVVAVEKDRALRLFELPTLEADHDTIHRGPILSLAFSPDSQLLATAAPDDTVKIWNVAEGRVRTTLSSNAQTPYALSFLNPDTLVIGAADTQGQRGQLLFWKLTPQPQLLRSISTGLPFLTVPHTNGHHVALWQGRGQPNALNHQLSLYEIATGRLVHDSPPIQPAPQAMSITPDHFAVFGDSRGWIGSMVLDNPKSLQLDWALFNSPIADVGLTSDRKFLVAADKQGTIKIADLARRQVLAELSDKTDGVRLLLTSPDGRHFITVSANQQRVKLWSLAGAKTPAQPVRVWDFIYTVQILAFSPNGQTLAAALADGTVACLELPAAAGPK
jgi:WD40 repeat protein